jgi:NAD(P)-dependent dehydrogenase (short-subunit alcohol dehydrogenase family)
MSTKQMLPADLFSGQTVFVTGGGSGINLGIARGFAALGASISICGRTLEKLQKAKADLLTMATKVSISVADVREYDALEEAVSRTEEECGPINCLVCGAAGNFLAPAEALSPNGFKAVVDIDLLGSFNAARASFDQLKRTKGNLIFISAGQAFIPYHAQAHVGAAKAGIDNLMQNLALEWGRYGIRSNSIAPGPIDGTEGMKRLAPGAIKDKLAAVVPLRRLGSVVDIANAAVFLASPLASYVTGTRLVVDGGQNLPGSGLYGKMIFDAMGGSFTSDKS